MKTTDYMQEVNTDIANCKQYFVLDHSLWLIGKTGIHIMDAF